MKKIGIGAGIFLVLLVAVALVAPGFIDWNEYKDQIETTASDLSDRQVKINGDLSLSIIPSPSFSAEDVSVSNVEGGQVENFITLKSVDVNVALFPLLRGDIQVNKFILVEPIIALEIDENGRGNWEFGSEQESQQDSGSTDMSFERFQVENGQLSYHDLSTGTQELVRSINAAVSMDSLQGPFKVVGDARYKNLPVSVDLNVGVMREGRKIPIGMSAGFLDDDIQMEFSGGLLLDDISPQADGKIELTAGDIGDIELAISLLNTANTNMNGRNFDHPLSLETTFAYGGDAINISALDFEMGESRGSGNLTATFGDLTRFDGNLAVNSLDLDQFLVAVEENNNGEDSGNNQTAAETDYSFLDTLEGNFRFTLGAIQYNDKIASQLDLEMTAANKELNFNNANVKMPGGSELTFSGAFAAPGNKPFFTGRTNVSSGNIRAFLDWLKIDTSSVPEGRLTRFSYNGAIQATPDLLNLYGIDGSLDTVKFTGGVSYALQDRPSMGLDVAVENLNVDNYLQQSEEASDYRAMVAILSDFDANYKIGLSNLTTQGVTVRKIDLTGELFSGQLNAKEINVEDYAGFDLNGSLIGNNLAENPQFETSFNTTADSLVPLQRAYRFKTEFDIAQVGAVAVNSRITGDFEKLDIDLKSTVGASKVDVKGEVRSTTLKQLPDIGSVDLEVAASNPSLAAFIDQFDLPLTKASANDDRPVSVTTKLKGTRQLVDLDGVINVASTDIALKGRANLTENEISSYELALDLQGDDVREFIRGLGNDFRPSNPDLGPIALKMAASGSLSNVSLSNISGTVGPTKLTGSGEINALDAVPEEGQKTGFDFNLVLDDVPAADFMEAKPEVSEGEEWGNWSEEPMELAVLDQYDGRATITANRINYDTYDFENPRFEMVLQNGVLNISNFTGKLFGGDVNVAGSFSSAGDLSMDMALTNATLTDATASFAGISPITGTFDMTQKFTGKGQSQDQLISSLNGTGEVKTSSGIINGIDIPALSERLEGLTSQNGLMSLLGTALGGGQTPYEGGASALTTENGFIKLTPFDVNMLGANSDIDMGINLAQWKMDLSGMMSLSDHPEAPPIGINVVGDIHNPSIEYNTRRLEGFIGQKIAASLLQNMVEGNGGIGGLFGGTEQGGANPQAPAGEGAQTVPGDTSPNARQEEVTTSPLDEFLTPPPPEEETQTAEEPQQTPAQDETQQSVEELGTRLLERLFNRPPPPQTPPPD